MKKSELHRRTLGITGDTNESGIQAAYRRQMLKWHPDLAPSGQQSIHLEKAKRANAARDYLLLHPSSWTTPISTPSPTYATTPVVETVVSPSAPSPVVSEIKDEPVSEPQTLGEFIITGIIKLVMLFIVGYLGLIVLAFVGWFLFELIPALLGLLI